MSWLKKYLMSDDDFRNTMAFQKLVREISEEDAQIEQSLSREAQRFHRLTGAVAQLHEELGNLEKRFTREKLDQVYFLLEIINTNVDEIEHEGIKTEHVTTSMRNLSEHIHGILGRAEKEILQRK